MATKHSILGHRGASAQYAENTLQAFAAAVRLGADGVELDVRATSDGALAIVHDPALPDGRVVAATAAADLPDTVAMLDAALEACGPLLVNIEIKSDAGEGVGLVGPVAAAAARWGGEVLLSSFDPATVDACVATGLPSAQLTMLPDRPVHELVAWTRGRGCVAWHPWVHLLSEAGFVEAAHDAGLAVNTWTVDDPARIVELAAWGVDGIVTNDIPTARRALGLSPGRRG